MSDPTEKPAAPPAPIRFRKLANARDVRRAALKITNAVLAGEIPARTANAAIYALTLVQGSLQAEGIQERLEALEQLARAHQQSRGITYDQGA